MIGPGGGELEHEEQQPDKGEKDHWTFHPPFQPEQQAKPFPSNPNRIPLSVLSVPSLHD